MLKNLIHKFLDSSFLTHLFTLAIVTFGLFSLFSLKRDLIPPFQFNNLIVDIYIPGASSEDVERLITYPIEQSLRSLPGVKKITSQSNQGSSQITVALEYGTDNIQELIASAEKKIESIRMRLPDDIESIVVSEDKVTDVFAGALSLVGFDTKNPTHYQILKAIEKDLINIRGIISTSASVPEHHLYIDISSDKIRANEVSVEQIRKSLEKAIGYFPLGQLKTAQENYMVTIGNVGADIGKIKRLPIKANSAGRTVFLEDVAEINFRPAKAYTYSRYNGNRSAPVYLFKDTYTDSFEIEKAIDTKIENWQSRLPDELTLTKMMSGAHYIRQQIAVLNSNAVVGFLLVLLILMFFLNSRVAFMTAMGIPIAYLGTAIVLYLFDISIDLISLIGMILVIGMLVDDAIIVSERYTKLRADGVLPSVAARKAATDLFVPVSGTIMTTIVAFSPILFLKSEIAIILAAIPIVLISALAFSWFESFFILPNRLVNFVKTPVESRPTAKRLMFFLEEAYVRSLKFVIRLKWVAILFICGLFGVSLYIAAKKLPQDFNLSVQPERLSVYAHLKGGPSLDEAEQWVSQLEDEFMQLPKNEVDSVATYIGEIWEAGKTYRGNRYIKVNLNFPANTKYPSKLKEILQKKVEPILEPFRHDTDKLYVEFEKEGDEKESESLMDVYVRGNDNADYNQLETAVVKAVEQVKGVTEYVSDSDQIQETWVFVPDYVEIAKASASQYDLLSHLKSLLIADKVTEMRIEGESYEVYTTLDHSKDHSYDDLNEIKILNHYGVEVPIAMFGHWDKRSSLKSIYHRNGERQLKFSFKLDKDFRRDQTQKLVQTELDELKTAFPSYQFEAETISEQEQENRSWALQIVLACFLGVFFVLALTLGNITQPFLAALPIPFGFIGSILALYAHSYSLTLMAMIGLVGMIGVSVNASIVMVDHINRMQAELNDYSLSTIIEGARSRLRAILLTTLTTLGGLFPMAYSLGGESGFTQPLAFSLGWGLLVSTILTLYYLPLLMSLRQVAIHKIHSVDVKKIIQRGRSAELTP